MVFRPGGQPPRSPGTPKKRKVPKVQTVPCPTCHVEVGRACVGIKGQDLPKVHPRRRLAGEMPQHDAPGEPGQVQVRYPSR